MEPGILRICEQSTEELEPSKAFIFISVTSNKFVFGNAAITASEEVKSIVTKLTKDNNNIVIEIESVDIESESDGIGKHSKAVYKLKLTVDNFSYIGEILGICSDKKNVSVTSIQWDYEDEKLKLRLSKEAMKKAKIKADQMMEIINYSVVGIRACSDSYRMPDNNKIIIRERHDTTVSSRPLAPEASMMMRRTEPHTERIDFGTSFERKKRISAECTVEFLVMEKNSTASARKQGRRTIKN